MLKYDYTENEIVLCREFMTEVEARLALAALESEGIEATIDIDTVRNTIKKENLFIIRITNFSVTSWNLAYA